MVELLKACLALPIVLYLPGLIWSRVFYTAADPLDRHYDRAILSALWSGWLALLLATLGLFSLWLQLGLTLLGCGLGWLLGKRRGFVRMERTPMPVWEQWLYLGMLLLFAACVARPFETMLGGRDAGVYANTGYLIARTGKLVQHEPLIAEIGRAINSADRTAAEAARQVSSNLLGVKNAERWIATRYTQPGFFINAGELEQGRVVPQFFHLYPAWIGLWTSILGLHGGLLATGYLGLLGLWSVAMTGRRLLGARIGGFVLMLLALNTVQIWFSRYSTAEASMQMTLWAGLAAWSYFIRTATQQSSAAQGWYAVLGGLALGQTALARIEFFGLIIPVAGYLIYAVVRRRWDRGHSLFAGALALMSVHGLVHIGLVARAYFFDTGWARFQDFALTSWLSDPFYTDLLREIRRNNSRKDIINSLPRLLAELGMVAALIAGLYALRRWPQLLDRGEAWIQRNSRFWLRVVAALLVLLGAYGYLIRPQVITTDVLADPLSASSRLRLESYIGAPLPALDSSQQQIQRAVVAGNMLRLGWYLSPLGIVLGVIGLAGWLWREGDRRSWLVLLIGIGYTIFPIRDTYGTADQAYIYIARRFMPGALPALSLGSAWAINFLLNRRAWYWRAAGWGATGLLLLFLLATGWRSVRHIEYAGALNAIEQLAGRIEPEAIVLMRGGEVRDTPTNLATPLRYAFGREVLVAYSANPAPYRQQLADQVRLWQTNGRPVYLLLGANGGGLYLPGFELEDQGLFRIDLAEWQQLQRQKPFTAGPIRFAYRLYRLRPSTPAPLPQATTIKIDDYRWQLQGWYPVQQDRPEGTGSTPYVWSNGASSILLPATTLSTTLEFQLGAGVRPPSLAQQPIPVCPLLGTLATTATLALPCAPLSATLPLSLSWSLPPLDETLYRQLIGSAQSSAAPSWTLTLSAPTWQPDAYASEYPTPPNDARPLAFQWFGAVLRPQTPQ